MSYEQHMREHRRCTILRLLDEEPSLRLNESFLHTALQPFDLRSTRDAVGSDLDWLAAEGLIEVDYHLGVRRALITPIGQEVAQRQRIHPGVHPPTPRR